MVYPTIDQYNLSDGMGQMFVYGQAVVPFYADLLFGVLLAIITFGIYFSQEVKKRKRRLPSCIRSRMHSDDSSSNNNGNDK